MDTASTGVSAPYEVPEKPDVTIHTVDEDVRVAAERLRAALYTLWQL